MKKIEIPAPVDAAKTGDNAHYSPFSTPGLNLTHMGINSLELCVKT